MPATERPAVSLESLKELPVTLAPNLMSMIGYPASARFVMLYYMGTCATWADGRASASFSFYSVWEPLTRHPAIAYHLLDVSLGHDDEEPTHALVCDRETRKMYLAPWDEAARLVRGQHGDQEPDAAAVAEYATLLEPFTTGAEMRRAGMFELFARPDGRAEMETAQLLAWLDSCITEELVMKVCRGFSAGDLRLWPQVGYLKHWLAAMKAAHGGEEFAGEPEESDGLPS